MNLERFDWRIILSIAVFSMLMQQAFSYVCQIAMPILADRIAEDFGISRAWLGFYLFFKTLRPLSARWVAAALSCDTARYGSVNGV